MTQSSTSTGRIRVCQRTPEVAWRTAIDARELARDVDAAPPAARSIQNQAEPYGICKIIPPEGWRNECNGGTTRVAQPARSNAVTSALCSCSSSRAVDMNSPKTFPTKRQRIDVLQARLGLRSLSRTEAVSLKPALTRSQEGRPYDDGGSYTLQQFRENADKFRREWCASTPARARPAARPMLTELGPAGVIHVCSRLYT